MIFTPARVSLALLSLRKNGGLLVVYDFLDAALVFKGRTIALVGVQRGGGGCQLSEPFHIFLEEIVGSSSAMIHKARNLVERMLN